jgi:hypothetical protein
MSRDSFNPSSRFIWQRSMAPLVGRERGEEGEWEEWEKWEGGGHPPILPLLPAL